MHKCFANVAYRLSTCQQLRAYGQRRNDTALRPIVINCGSMRNVDVPTRLADGD
eukprot:COSAG02_NODE_59025_length_275_cov_0.886364_1_plen_53_part_10